MMSNFIREPRYIVLKISDLHAAGLSEGEIYRFNGVCDSVARSRVHRGKPPLECVVVEKDWPEYEPTWKAIQDRMTGCAAPAAPSEEVLDIETTLRSLAEKWHECCDDIHIPLIKVADEIAVMREQLTKIQSAAYSEEPAEELEDAQSDLRIIYSTVSLLLTRLGGKGGP